MGMNRKIESVITGIVEHYDISKKAAAMYGVQEMKKRYPDAYTYFQSLGFENVESIDVSDHQNPTYKLDLNKEVDKSMHNKYDLIYDGGTMEHCFNVAMVLSNTVKMLKKGGIIIHANPMTGWVNHAFYQFSPTLYYDFYYDNGFANMNSWIYRRKGYDKGDLFANKRLQKHDKYKKDLIIYTAMKMDNNTKVAFPIQERYKNSFMNRSNKRNWTSRNCDTQNIKIGIKV